VLRLDADSAAPTPPLVAHLRDDRSDTSEEDHRPEDEHNPVLAAFVFGLIA
jgi:hypothetical protein